MKTPVHEHSGTDTKPPEAKTLAGNQKSELDDTVRRLQGIFSEGHKTKATDPDAVFVPWHRFPDASKTP